MKYYSNLKKSQEKEKIREQSAKKVSDDFTQSNSLPSAGAQENFDARKPGFCARFKLSR
jgi:hypothetical protein